MAHLQKNKFHHHVAVLVYPAVICAAQREGGLLLWESHHRTHYVSARGQQCEDGGERELLLRRWGMVPFFATSLASYKGYSTFKAKAEGLAATATWREPFNKGRRCLVPASGFYSWKILDAETKRPEKQPTCSP